MSGKEMNWHLASKRRNAMAPRSDARRIPVQPDENFWRCWKDDKSAMRAAGYRVEKIERGGWRVFIEVR